MSEQAAESSTQSEPVEFISVKVDNFIVEHDHDAPALVLHQWTTQSKLTDEGFGKDEKVYTKCIIPGAWIPSVIQGLIDGLNCLDRKEHD